MDHPGPNDVETASLQIQAPSQEPGDLGTHASPLLPDGSRPLSRMRVFGVGLRSFLVALSWLVFLALATFLHPERSWPFVAITALAVAQWGRALPALQAILQDRFALTCSERSRECAGKAILSLATILVVLTLAYEICKDLRKLQPLFGLVVLMGCCIVASTDRQNISWSLVFRGFIIQILLAAFVTRTDTGYLLFHEAGEAMSRLLANSDVGAAFVFGNTPFVLATSGTYSSKVPPEEIPPFKVHFFAFKVLPSIIFFSAFVSCMQFLGVLQAVVSWLSQVLRVLMGTSPPESVNAVANIFLGQTEAPILIKEFLPTATDSEIHAVMTSGFATIAGSVMGAYMSMGISPLHLLAASVMSAPASLAISKIIYPEAQSAMLNQDRETTGGASADLQMTVSAEKNIIEAAGNGASMAIGLVANIAAMLIAFLSLISVLNGTLSYLGDLIDLPGLSFERICGYLFAPLAWLVGAPNDEMFVVGELIGTKFVLNEFVAYEKLARLKQAGNMSTLAELAATYSLCGFANLGSLGITLGGLSTLASERKQAIARLVFSAMLSGGVTSLVNASVASILQVA